MKTPKRVVLDAFGGVRATARALKLTPGAVSKWGDNVPSKHHAELLRVAKAEKRKLTAEMLVMGAK